ncbi:MAG: hypothetical protein RLZZ182_1306 [Pseudomonadota bacterium]|jgi:hypothetical protein
MKQQITSAVFLIEGGKALELIQEYIQERRRVRGVISALCQELGVEEVCTDRETGVLTRVVFKDKVHKDFTVPDKRGTSRPKVGSEWDKRFDAQQGHRHCGTIIQEQLHVVTSLEVTKEPGHRGVRRLGNLFYPCGFLYLTESGPYAMYVPDLPRECEAIEAQGETIVGLASRDLQFDGCKRIEKEEWEIMVLQQKLKDRQSGATHEPV